PLRWHDTCMSDCYFSIFNAAATTEIYTLSLHDALPISSKAYDEAIAAASKAYDEAIAPASKAYAEAIAPASKAYAEALAAAWKRSEEHTSELQSRRDLVCRLLLEKKKKHNHTSTHHTCR